MHAKSKSFRFRSAGIAVALSLLALSAPACERSEESFRAVRNAQATHPYRLSAEKAQLIKQLEGAKEMDVSQAHRPGVSAVAWEDDMTQAAKADKAMKELSDGFEVPPSELDDALSVPPASLADGEKSRLINEVKQAIQNDQHQEDSVTLSSNMAIYPYPTNAMVRLEDHKELAQGVLKDLESGQDVHWQTIRQAIQTPGPED